MTDSIRMTEVSHVGYVYIQQIVIQWSNGASGCASVDGGGGGGHLGARHEAPVFPCCRWLPDGIQLVLSSPFPLSAATLVDRWWAPQGCLHPLYLGTNDDLVDLTQWIPIKSVYEFPSPWKPYCVSFLHFLMHGWCLCNVPTGPTLCPTVFESVKQSTSSQIFWIDTIGNMHLG